MSAGHDHASRKQAPAGSPTHRGTAGGIAGRTLGTGARTQDGGWEEAHAAWVDWLRRVKWDWFVTLTYGAPANGGSQEGIRRDTQNWLAALRAEKPTAYAVVAVECGPHLGGWHAHVLVGGVGAWAEWDRRLRRSWRRGPVHCVAYDPRLEPRDASVKTGACAYVLKEMPHAEVEIHGKLRKWRPRRKSPPAY